MEDSLTASERRVVELVALGCTNQEVADALSLRPKTIEWTLTKVYRKVDVRSRTELVLKLTSIPGIFPGAGREADRIPVRIRGERSDLGH